MNAVASLVTLFVVIVISMFPRPNENGNLTAFESWAGIVPFALSTKEDTSIDFY